MLALALLLAVAPPAPSLVLWAWERPEDLRFIDTREVGVAYLAGTVGVRGDAVEARPRMQPLRVPADASMTAVVRIEARAPAMSAAQAREVAQVVARLADAERARCVQVDFDAALSERTFYAAVLREIRPLLRPDQRLEMTALASWCLSDRWLDDAPVDSVVPMAFRMGRDDARVRRALRDGELDARCAGALGVATDEPLPRVPDGARVFAFSAKPWTPGSVAALRASVDRARGGRP